MLSCNNYDQILLFDRHFSAEREATNLPKGVSSVSNAPLSPPPDRTGSNSDPFEMDKQHTNPIYTEEYGGW